ncbi:YicC/YloC family endoribonuclease [Pseudooctadecabacter jejudonensis]|uniref:YicC-like family, N-terminal region n=1 Tax=Pseudooctadecabacter jejudonensis TaxID=1391910 RepID=A0A1Y5REY8_9RHOB|nr:YicC/YloC family endoribonuclease [Pseudooctadecabacter jejudonensis]SLN15955.1 hypothetical protein PSJ8397_00382 [Pseudooctadecabacter jejudonensis]
MPVIRSMTAFATAQGTADATTWVWDIRSVNGRGLDVKVRLPDGFSTLEGEVRRKISAVCARGNITVGLRLNRAASDGVPEMDQDRLDIILGALDQIQDRAFEKGVTLGQPTAADVLAQRGVLVTRPTDDTDALIEPLTTDFDAALSAFIDMRTAEGATLHDLLTGQLNEIETLTAQAAEAAKTRTTAQKSQIDAALARIADQTLVEPDRIAQELALIAVKSDITEEIDRLGAHVAAARDLIATGGVVGRKLDFLAQEFNREANTLCSKAQDKTLTQIGLALKAVIDQMREQVQNTE